MKTIAVRLTDAEYNAIAAAAVDAQSRNLSQWVRARLMESVGRAPQRRKRKRVPIVLLTTAPARV